MADPAADARGDRIELAKLYEDAFGFAEQAHALEENGHRETAQTFLVEAVSLFMQIRDLEVDARKITLLTSKITEFTDHIGELTRADAAPVAAVPAPVSEAQTKYDEAESRAKFAFEQALVEDEKGNQGDALELYIEAAHLFIALTKNPLCSETARSSTMSILARAEEIKRGAKKPVVAGAGGSRLLSEAEKSVLIRTSTINGKLFVPFIDRDFLEKFNLPEPFVDPDGNLPLSAKQMAEFGGWRRPSEFIRGKAPVMIQLISCYAITQTVITDCSFVASLAVAAAYERKFKRQLITSCIYPQDRRGQPVINPSGKYMIRLTLNGLPRKVVIDDRLPVSRHGTLLCSHSTNKEELWVSLIEKAFLKVHGGYDFPGSNSGIDLHMLTGGWIPEKLDTHAEGFNKDKEWRRMESGLRLGDCVLTIATDDSLPEAKYEELGLVPTHAYAVLDVKEVLGKRLLLVKNPWSHKRWQGAYSQNDRARWTPELQRALNYDVMKAMQVDNGVFWIDYDSACIVFARIHMSWNPDCFKYRSAMHGCFPEGGPKNDSYNMGYNPQYAIALDNSTPNPAPLWLLLSRHSTRTVEKSDEFITLHVYGGDIGGKKVYYPAKAQIQGVYQNSPHYLVRFDVPAGRSMYTLVVSQYEKKGQIDFSLHAYSTVQFRLGEIPLRYAVERRIPGKWEAATAGGSSNNRATFQNNPQYRLEITKQSQMVFRLELPKDYAGNVKMLRRADRASIVLVDETVADSGAYRNGFCYFEATVPPGTYVVAVSTFNAGEIGGYFLSIGSDQDFKISTL